MPDPSEVVIVCESAEMLDLLRAFLRANDDGIPDGYRELREAFSQVFWKLHARLPAAELFLAINGRSVGELIRLHGGGTEPTPIASGEKDGVKWSLHDPPAG